MHTYCFVHMMKLFLVFYILVHFYPLINIFDSCKAHYLRLRPCWHIFLLKNKKKNKSFIYSCVILQVPKPIPVALDDLCRQTKFTRQEIRVMYRGFKTVRLHFYVFIRPFSPAKYFTLLIIFDFLCVFFSCACLFFSFICFCRNAPKASYMKIRSKIFMPNFSRMEVSISFCMASLLWLSF